MEVTETATATAYYTPAELAIGSSGQNVKFLQALLVKEGFPLKIDGEFGNTTRSAVIKYQTSKQIKNRDGIVGFYTWSKLGVLAGVPN